MSQTAGAMLDAGEEAPAVPAGIRLDGGEVVILSLRQHWSAPAFGGLAPTLALAAFLAVLVAQRSTPMPSRLLGILAAMTLAPLAAALMRHAVRRYVLTDRRVILRDFRGTRWVPLSSVRQVLAPERSGEGRPGDVTFRTEQGVMVWTRSPRAGEVAQIASDAVRRYGRR